ncbi:hypothetical protein JCM11641_005806 [Rhodosporidiobolus odoratus]
MQVLPNKFEAPTMDPFEAFATSDWKKQQAEKVKNTPPPALIRPFRKQDLPLVRYLIGSGVMEPSSLANQVAIFRPLSFLLCLAISHLLVVRFTSGYPAVLHNLLFPSSPKALNPDAKILQTITDGVMLIPLMIAPFIALLALFEMRHRGLFENEMRRTIGDEDVRDIVGYYGVDQASVGETEKKPDGREQRKGFWVLEYDGRLIGAIALDGRKPGQALDSVVDHIKARESSNKKAEAPPSSETAESATTTATETTGSAHSRKLPAPSLSVTPPTPVNGSPSTSYALSSSSALPEGTLHLRQFHTSLSFRSAGIEDDLLAFVAEQAFSSTPLSSSGESSTTAPPAAEQVVFTLRPGVQKSLKKTFEKAGWDIVPQGSELEVQLSSAAGRSESGLVDLVWPVSLQKRTMVLRRSAWEKREKERSAKEARAQKKAGQAQ